MSLQNFDASKPEVVSRCRGTVLGALSRLRPGRFATAFERADPLRHLQQMLAHFIARDLPEVAHQFDLFAAETVGFLGSRFAAQFLEEERDRPIEQPRRFEQATGAQTVFAVLVFLNRLERDADTRAELFLTHPGEKPRLTQTPANVNIDRIGSVLTNRATTATGCMRFRFIALINLGHSELPPSIDQLIILTRLYTISCEMPRGMRNKLAKLPLLIVSVVTSLKFGASAGALIEALAVAPEDKAHQPRADRKRRQCAKHHRDIT